MVSLPPQNPPGLPESPTLNLECLNVAIGPVRSVLDASPASVPIILLQVSLALLEHTKLGKALGPFH